MSNPARPHFFTLKIVIFVKISVEYKYKDFNLEIFKKILKEFVFQQKRLNHWRFKIFKEFPLQCQKLPQQRAVQGYFLYKCNNHIEHGVGGHTGLWSDASPRRGLCQSFMLEYAHRCRTSTVIIVPINFWQNSDPFKKKEHFSSSKIDRVRAFFINISNFQ